MKRRTAIKQLLIVAGGLVLVPSCMRESGKTSIDLANLDLNASDEDRLAAIVETIIPETDSPGGKSLNLHLFVLKMIDDCHGEADQLAFVTGLRDWAREARNTLSDAYEDADVAEQIAFVETVNGDSEHPLAGFFGLVKRRTIQGYLNSQHVMTHELVYELVPGRYDGYAPA